MDPALEGLAQLPKEVFDRVQFGGVGRLRYLYSTSGRSRPPPASPTCQNHRRYSRNASRTSPTAPPEHGRNQDASVFPASPARCPSRLPHGAPADGPQTGYLSTVNWVTINVPVLTAVVFKWSWNPVAAESATVLLSRCSLSVATGLMTSSSSLTAQAVIV